MKYTPPSFLFPESSLFLSARYTENLAGCMDKDSISRESYVSVKQSMLQSLMSLWKEILTLSLSTLLSIDWTLASNILGSGGWCALLLSWTRSPLRIPRLHWQCFGLPSGMSAFVPGGYDQRSWGKVIFPIVMLVSYLRSDNQKLFPAVCNNTKNVLG